MSSRPRVQQFVELLVCERFAITGHWSCVVAISTELSANLHRICSARDVHRARARWGCVPQGLALDDEM